MNLKKMLGVAAAVVFVMLAASYTRVQALSLVNPSSGWTSYENVTTQIQWRRNYIIGDVTIGVIMVANIHSGDAATGGNGDWALRSV